MSTWSRRWRGSSGTTGSRRCCRSAPAGRGRTRRQRRTKQVSDVLADSGWVEVISYPFTSVETFDAYGLEPDDPRRQAVRLANPMSDELPLMRTMVLDTLLTTLKRNLGRGIRDLALFEVSSRRPSGRAADGTAAAAGDRPVPHDGGAGGVPGGRSATTAPGGARGLRRRVAARVVGTWPRRRTGPTRSARCSCSPTGCTCRWSITADAGAPAVASRPVRADRAARRIARRARRGAAPAGGRRPRPAGAHGGSRGRSRRALRALPDRITAEPVSTFPPVHQDVSLQVGQRGGRCRRPGGAGRRRRRPARADRAVRRVHRWDRCPPAPGRWPTG